jgi:hypothetical protein
MKKIYEVPADKIDKLKKILEAPDGISGELDVELEAEQGKGGKEKAKSWKANEFKKQGYILREAKTLDISKKVFYLYIQAEDNFFKSHEKILLDASAKLLKGSEGDDIIKKIENSESNASSGIGFIFG